MSRDVIEEMWHQCAQHECREAFGRAAQQNCGLLPRSQGRACQLNTPVHLAVQVPQDLQHYPVPPRTS